jgi:hypothetical protein
LQAEQILAISREAGKWLVPIEEYKEWRNHDRIKYKSTICLFIA